MRKLMSLLLIVLLIAVMIPVANAQFCTGVLHSNLIPGDTALVVVEGVLNVRSEPSLSGELLTQLEPDTELAVISGPICADGYAWYELDLANERTGWAAESSSDEYWLGKLPRDYITYERHAEPNSPTPTRRLTYPAASIARIDYDSAAMHGVMYRGEQIILRRLDGHPIFITVIPFEDFETTPGGGYDRAEVLRLLVDDWSDVALDWAYPYPNSQGQWATTVALKELQEFQNGRGFSYVAAYIDRDQFQPVDQDSFWYVFHGMTSDGTYFVNISMPLQPPQLPAGPPYDPDDLTEYFAGYLPWLEEINAFLLTQAGASFSPQLGMVKSIVYSLEIE